MKRFYKDVSVTETGGAFQIRLDARPIKTAAGNRQLLPGRTLAESMALEWSEQGETIDPALFRYRDLADFAIDQIAPGADDTIAKLVAFAETDTLCYRADPDEPFYRRQVAVWDPILSAFEQAEQVSFERISGIIHKPQPRETLERLAARISQLDPFAMASLQALTSLSASLCIGLQALAEPDNIEALWSAACLEEEWQIEQWGLDHEAEFVRTRRRADFLNAWEFARLAKA